MGLGLYQLCGAPPLCPRLRGAFLASCRGGPGSVRANSLRAGTVGTQEVQEDCRGEGRAWRKMDACHLECRRRRRRRLREAKPHEQNPQQIAGSPCEEAEDSWQRCCRRGQPGSRWM
ncbi:uncharacterized protein LOC119088092 isoform X2 [Peromyscus leucopus]|uniref:uncharacterized protein LOC119088092 isoform X2 n=1 Tax=Peromyscus leucopus TaxID=10041 RepID=UPI001884FE50|nr:uncharacterized protein LOC119088092 isoform X2 [Peromyscus leucopus]